jgi:hypothetical protein
MTDCLRAFSEACTLYSVTMVSKVMHRMGPIVCEAMAMVVRSKLYWK